MIGVAYNENLASQMSLVEEISSSAINEIGTLEAKDINVKRLQRDLETILSEVKEKEKIFSAQSAKKQSLSMVYNLKNFLGKRITEVINELLKIRESGKAIEDVERVSLFLEDKLGQLGITLYSMPIGEKYDFNIDGLVSMVGQVFYDEEHSDRPIGAVPLYVTHSTFGAKRKDGYGFTRIIEKARVNLSDVMQKTEQAPEKI